MTVREKQYAYLFGSIGGALAFLFLAWQFFLSPYQDIERKIASVTDEVSKKDAEKYAILTDKKMMAKAAALSLPKDQPTAILEYDNYLKQVLRDCGLPFDNIVDPSPENIKLVSGGSNKKQAQHITLTFTVQVKGTLSKIVAALEEFNRTAVLHRIKSFTIDRVDTSATASAAAVKKGKGAGSDPRDPTLTMQLAIETLILSNASLTQTPNLKPDSSKPLPTPDNSRQYTALAQKNLFAGFNPPIIVPPGPGPGPKPLPKKEPDYNGLDVPAYVNLVQTIPSSNEAYFRSQVTKLRPQLVAAKNSLAQFEQRLSIPEHKDVLEIWDPSGGRILFKGKILRVDQREVFFKNVLTTASKKGPDDNIYMVHISQNLTDAMRKPLTTKEIEAYGLKEFVAAPPAPPAPPVESEPKAEAPVETPAAATATKVKTPTPEE